MNLVVVSDHVGLELKRELLDRLRQAGHICTDLGAYSTERCDYPVYAYGAASALAGGEFDRAVLICGTGVGMSLAANKVRGVRCVVCSEPYSAVLSRRHNDTNALALGARVVGSELAWMILESWLAEPYEGGRHQRRVDQIAQIEAGTFAPAARSLSKDPTSEGRRSYNFNKKENDNEEVLSTHSGTGNDGVSRGRLHGKYHPHRRAYGGAEAHGGRRANRGPH